MYNYDTNFIYHSRFFRTMVVFLVLFTSNTAYGAVIEKCPKSHAKQCKAGAVVLAEMVKNLDEIDSTFLLWDAKPSKLIKGYWHLAFTDDLTKTRHVVYTDGKFLVPNVIPLVPGRDFTETDNLDKSDSKVKAALKKQKRIKQNAGNQEIKTPSNQVAIEQNNIFLGPVDIDKLVSMGKAYQIVKGRKDFGSIIVVDDLMTDRMAIFLDDFRNKEKKWRPYKNASVYFLPFFGFMGNKRSAIVGKNFYGLIEAGVSPASAVYALSRLGVASKQNAATIKEYCLQLVSKENRPKFHRTSLETPFQMVFAKSAAAVQMGVMVPSYYIINGQLNMWGM